MTSCLRCKRLEEYAQHHGYCPLSPLSSIHGPDCTCGLSEALAPEPEQTCVWLRKQSDVHGWYFMGCCGLESFFLPRPYICRCGNRIEVRDA